MREERVSGERFMRLRNNLHTTVRVERISKAGKGVVGEVAEIEMGQKKAKKR
jgi:hypothetical protein